MMNTSVSANSNHSRFSSKQTETVGDVSVSPKSLPAKSYARSPYREKTVMLRVPVSLMAEFQQRLAQHKQRVAAGNHDNWD
jgi:hypothetical protein